MHLCIECVVVMLRTKLTRPHLIGAPGCLAKTERIGDASPPADAAAAQAGSAGPDAGDAADPTAAEPPAADSLAADAEEVASPAAGGADAAPPAADAFAALAAGAKRLAPALHCFRLRVAESRGGEPAGFGASYEERPPAAAAAADGWQGVVTLKTKGQARVLNPRAEKWYRETLLA